MIEIDLHEYTELVRENAIHETELNHYRIKCYELESEIARLKNELESYVVDGEDM